MATKIDIPTRSVKVERSPPDIEKKKKKKKKRTEGCEFESQASHTKELKNGNRYLSHRAKLESDIDKPERSGYLVGGCNQFCNAGISQTDVPNYIQCVSGKKRRILSRCK